VSLLTNVVAGGITGFTRLVTGARARWLGCAPEPAQRIYYGNHSSHADFVLIWASLPRALRAHTRPVAGADYWERGALRRFLIHEVLHGVLVDRERANARDNPVDAIVTALDAGTSLIFFPEGTRNTTEETLLPFRSGLYHVACRRPDVELVPVWMENLGRVLPKGAVVPVPLLCSINFGAPLRVTEGEEKTQFLMRARNALLDLSAVSRNG
jgi:1-acyl-sn-glycerol-3-phosphate acyltransferase